jgi:hypothetical protein
MINPPPRRYMRSDATKLSSADYEDIMQYRDMKSKPLEELRKKFHISTSRLYQIWRGQEVGRVEWNYSAVPLSYSSINAIDKQYVPEASALLDNMIQDISLDCNTASGSKKKKTGGTGGKKPRSKSVIISEPFTIQTKPTPENSAGPEAFFEQGTQGKGLHGKELRAFYEKGVKEDEKSKAETARLLAIT